MMCDDQDMVFLVRQPWLRDVSASVRHCGADAVGSHVASRSSVLLRPSTKHLRPSLRLPLLMPSISSPTPDVIGPHVCPHHAISLPSRPFHQHSHPRPLQPSAGPEPPPQSADNPQGQFLGLVSAETLLVGHALENDLRVLRVLHGRIVDTAILYPHPKVPSW